LDLGLQLRGRARCDQIAGDRVRRDFRVALDLARERLQHGEPPCDEGDVPALAGDAAGERGADAARRAGYEPDVLSHVPVLLRRMGRGLSTPSPPLTARGRPAI